jgi:hypothetical protein
VNKILATVLVFANCSAFAATAASDFVGTYALVHEQVEGKTFCFNGIQIVLEGNEMSLYRQDIADFAMFKAQVNGSPREVRGSHGEAMSSSVGENTVTLDRNGVLIFAYTGIEKVMGIPMARSKDAYALRLSQDGKSIEAIRSTFDGVMTGIGSKGKATCQYRR